MMLHLLMLQLLSSWPQRAVAMICCNGIVNQTNMLLLLLLHLLLLQLLLLHLLHLLLCHL